MFTGPDYRKIFIYSFIIYNDLFIYIDFSFIHVFNYSFIHEPPRAFKFQLLGFAQNLIQ